MVGAGGWKLWTGPNWGMKGRVCVRAWASVSNRFKKGGKT